MYSTFPILLKEKILSMFSMKNYKYADNQTIVYV